MSTATENPTSVTQTENVTLQKGDSTTFEREVASIRLATGKLFVSGNDKDAILTGTDEVTFDNAAAISVHAPEAATFAVTFADNAVMPVFQNRTAAPAELSGDAALQQNEPRGDTGGSGGSFESRTVPELRKLAKERGVTVTGKKGRKPVKADFVKALRA